MFAFCLRRDLGLGLAAIRASFTSGFAFYLCLVVVLQGVNAAKVFAGVAASYTPFKESQTDKRPSDYIDMIAYHDSVSY